MTIDSRSHFACTGIPHDDARRFCSIYAWKIFRRSYELAVVADCARAGILVHASEYGKEATRAHVIQPKNIAFWRRIGDIVYRRSGQHRFAVRTNGKYPS